MNLNEVKEKTAVVILAYSDYESLELSLATHAKFTVPSGMHIYILQNGRGTYDCERTYNVGKRYHYLYPNSIDVVDDIPQGKPYHSLKTMFQSERFKKYDYIIKLDDDVLVLTQDWSDKLCSLFIDSKSKYGDELAYVTSLVNNNPYGFKKIIEYNEELANEYFSSVAREHLVGAWEGDSFGGFRVIPKEKIVSGSNGTIWGYPYMAKWLHRKTTLVPEKFVELASGFGIEEINSIERYSINCMMFDKELWENIDDGGSDDEHMCQAYCIKYKKRIFCDLSIPMAHLFFFAQRTECKDMIDEMREVYEKYLNLDFSISVCNNRLMEIENRLRFMETPKTFQSTDPKDILCKDMPFIPRKIIGLIVCFHRMGFWFTVKESFRKIKHKIFR